MTDQWTEYREAHEQVRRENPLQIPMHEAAHAVVAYHHRYAVHGIAIGLGTESHVLLGPSQGRARISAPRPYEEDPDPPVLWSRLRTAAEVTVAGNVAEIEFLGLPSVSDTIVGLANEYGKLELAVCYAFPRWNQDHIDAYIDAAEARAHKILRANRATLDHLAAALAAEEPIEGPRLEQLLKPIKRRPERASDNAGWATLVAESALER
jgi:hypothetical protein